MPTLQPVLKRIEDEGGLQGTLYVEYTLYESNGQISIQLENVDEEYIGHVYLYHNDDHNELPNKIHRVREKSEREMIAKLEEYLTQEELLPSVAEFLTDRELLEVIRRDSDRITTLLETVRVQQETVASFQKEYLIRHPEALGYQSVLKRISEDPLQEG